MRKPQTMSIGGATYDLFVRTDRSLVERVGNRDAFLLPLGEKVLVKEVIETCGGGAANTAVGLSRLGCDAGFCGIVGSDQWGEKLLKTLRAEGVTADYATVVEGEVTSFSLILSAISGERAILYAPGTNVHLRDVTFDRAGAERVAWVYLNRIQEATCEIEDDLIDILGKSAGPRLTWNPGGCQVEAGVEAKNNRLLASRADLLLLNKEEALQFAKAKTVDEAFRTLVGLGARDVCITDGKRGSTATDGKSRYHCPIIEEAPVVDTTGAGDAFGIGMTWALIHGLDLPTALQSGTINAASVVGVIGAQAGLLTDTEMKQRLSRVRLDVAVSPL